MVSKGLKPTVSTSQIAGWAEASSSSLASSASSSSCFSGSSLFESFGTPELQLALQQKVGFVQVLIRFDWLYIGFS